MGVEVREVVPGDVDEVRRVARRAWHEAHAPIVGEEAVEAFLEEHYADESLHSTLESEASIFDVAVDEDRVVGFLTAGPDDEEPATYHLGRVYVDPDRWGEGIGRRLLDRAERAIRRRGGERIELGVMAENDRAVGFYESTGYEREDGFHDERIDVEGFRYAKRL